MCESRWVTARIPLRAIYKVTENGLFQTRFSLEHGNMSTKTNFYCLLAVLAVSIFSVNVKADEECVCKDYTDEEKQQIWDFLMKLSGDMSEEDGVIPGVLSPLVPCGNCLDGARRKRTILPSATARSIEINSDMDDYLAEPAVSQDSRCPVGYGRIAFRCISLAELYKKWSFVYINLTSQRMRLRGVNSESWI